MSEYVRTVRKTEKPLSSRLGRLDIELTERCSNNCIHCCINLPADDPQARSRELSTSRLKTILSEAAALGSLRVRFTGGEPLLRPDFGELYLFARRLGLKVLIFTNATLITEPMADLFARIPPLEKMEITVYGMHRESYEAVTRVPGSFYQFRRGVNLLLERRVPFVFKTAILPPNRHEIEEFEIWAESMPWSDKKPSYAMFFDLRNRRDDAAKNKIIASLRLTPEEGLAVLTRHEEKFRKGMQEFAEKFMGPPGDILFNCGAGKGIAIDAYGRAQPCLSLRAPEMSVDLAAAGSNPPSLSDALRHFAAIGGLRAVNPVYLRRCARCFLKGLCEQCPAKSWAEHGTLDAPVDYFCAVAHAKARYLGWLGEGEVAWEVRNWKQNIKKGILPDMQK